MSGREQDEAEIRRLSYRYARAADRRDYDAYRGLFTEDGQLTGFEGAPGEGTAQPSKAHRADRIVAVPVL